MIGSGVRETCHGMLVARAAVSGGIVDVQIALLLPAHFLGSSKMAVSVSPAILVTDLGEGGRAMMLPVAEADGVQWVNISTRCKHSYALPRIRALILGHRRVQR